METFKHSYKSNDDINILINVYNTGYQKCEAGYGLFSVVRNAYLIHHVVSGCGYYVVNENKYKLQKGDTFLILPNTVVSYYADKEDPWEYYWVGFGGADVKNLLSKTALTKEKPITTTNKSDELKNILLEIYNVRGNNLYNHVRMTGYLYLFLSILIEASPNNQTSVDISQEYIKKAVHYISEYYHTKISVNDIASYLGVSRSHLYRVFIKHLSQSPKAYLEGYRIQQSKTLLKKTNLTISQISSLVGYDDQLHFSKVFKKIALKTPKEYRKNNIV